MTDKPMSRRDTIAAMALQGLLSSPSLDVRIDNQTLARTAVVVAKDLIKELDKQDG